jgi:hypothetical protein
MTNAKHIGCLGRETEAKAFCETNPGAYYRDNRNFSGVLMGFNLYAADPADHPELGRLLLAFKIATRKAAGLTAEENNRRLEQERRQAAAERQSAIRQCLVAGIRADDFEIDAALERLVNL